MLFISNPVYVLLWQLEWSQTDTSDDLNLILVKCCHILSFYIFILKKSHSLLECGINRLGQTLSASQKYLTQIRQFITMCRMNR